MNCSVSLSQTDLRSPCLTNIKPNLTNCYFPFLLSDKWKRIAWLWDIQACLLKKEKKLIEQLFEDIRNTCRDCDLSFSAIQYHFQFIYEEWRSQEDKYRNWLALSAVQCRPATIYHCLQYDHALLNRLLNSLSLSILKYAPSSSSKVSSKVNHAIALVTELKIFNEHLQKHIKLRENALYGRYANPGKPCSSSAYPE